MLDLYKNIRKLRLEQGLSQEELAKKTGYSDRSSIAKIESGGVDLTQSKIKLFAEVLGTTPIELMGWDEEDENPHRTGRTIPIYDRVAAGIPIEAIDNVIDTEEIPFNWVGEYAGLKVKGDSMAPRILDGDYLIVRKQSDAESGDIVIAFVNGQDATVKRLIKLGHGIQLQPFNPAYEPLYFSNEDILRLPVTIWGKVVENRQKF